MAKRKTGRKLVTAEASTGNNDAARLRGAGLRGTAPRIAVLRFLERATAPLSHGDIYQELAVRGFDRATIYRNLINLADAGLVSRTDLGDHIWRFELRREPGRLDERRFLAPVTRTFSARAAAA